VVIVAIAVRTGEQTRQLQVVCLDELVPVDDPLRRVEQLVSWHAVRESARPFYVDFGRPGVDPVVLVKLFLVAALRGIGSMRETLRVAEDSVSIRRFLGYGLTEALPHHGTLSYAQCVRFADSSVFEQLFTQVLRACAQAGLLDGRRLVVDATHVEADAALASLRAELRAAEAPEQAAGDEGEPTGAPGKADEPPTLLLAPPRTGPIPRRRASNATARCLSDPDAALRAKPGQRPHLVHRAQVATDPKARVIVAVRAERATGHEGTALPELVARARWAGHQVAELVADSGYASQGVYQDLEARRVTALIPPQPNMLGHPEGRAARERCCSALGRSAYVDRQAHGEGAICELKLRHALARARSRGTPKLQLQLLLAATAINLKRLMANQDAAQAAGAGPAAGTGPAAPAAGLTWAYEACLN
jgi:transposase